LRIGSIRFSSSTGRAVVRFIIGPVRDRFGSWSVRFVRFGSVQRASRNVGIEVYIIQCCRCLSMMADVFRCKMIEHSDSVGVAREWNLIHALCREVSRTNQPAVVVCQQELQPHWCALQDWALARSASCACFQECCSSSQWCKCLRWRPGSVTNAHEHRCL